MPRKKSVTAPTMPATAAATRLKRGAVTADEEPPPEPHTKTTRSTAPDGAEPPATGAKGRGRPPKAAAASAEHVNGGVTAPAKRGPGRPAKAKVHAAAEDETIEDRVVKAHEGAAGDPLKAHAQHQTGKRKKDQTEEEVIEEIVAKESQAPKPGRGNGGATAPAKRGPGRPAKPTVHAAAEEETIEDRVVKAHEEAAGDPLKAHAQHKTGKRKKDQTEEEVIEEIVAKESQPPESGRGRPKRNLAEVQKTSEPVANKNKDTEGRGRKKARTEFDVIEDVVQKISEQPKKRHGLPTGPPVEGETIGEHVAEGYEHPKVSRGRKRAHNEEEEIDNIVAEASQPPRHSSGRPTRAAAKTAEPQDVDAEPSEPPKKRGRPSRSEAAPTEPPKRRGRPPREATQQVEPPTAGRGAKKSTATVTEPKKTEKKIPASKKPAGRRPRTAVQPTDEDIQLQTELSHATEPPAGAKKQGRRVPGLAVEIKQAGGEGPNEQLAADVDLTHTEGPAHWLMKAEPNSRIENGIDVKFSIDDLRVASKPEPWEGVRNHVAKNNMMAMKRGDLAFFYHSNCKVPGVAGIMEIVEEHSVDESAFDPKHPYHDEKSKRESPKWHLVHVEFRRKFPELVSLKELQSFGKPGGALESMQVLKQSRLSVSKVSKKEWDFIMKLVDGSEANAADASGSGPSDGPNDAVGAEALESQPMLGASGIGSHGQSNGEAPVSNAPAATIATLDEPFSSKEPAMSETNPFAPLSEPTATARLKAASRAASRAGSRTNSRAAFAAPEPGPSIPINAPTIDAPTSSTTAAPSAPAAPSDLFRPLQSYAPSQPSLSAPEAYAQTHSTSRPPSRAASSARAPSGPPTTLDVPRSSRSRASSKAPSRPSSRAGSARPPSSRAGSAAPRTSVGGAGLLATVAEDGGVDAVQTVLEVAVQEVRQEIVFSREGREVVGEVREVREENVVFETGMAEEVAEEEFAGVGGEEGGMEGLFVEDDGDDEGAGMVGEEEGLSGVFEGMEGMLE